MPVHGHGYIPPAFASVEITAVDDADGTATVTIQLKDAAGDDLAQAGLVRTWTSGRGGVDVGVPAAVSGAYAIAGTGETIETNVSKADLTIITGGDGEATLDLNDDQNGTLWVMASYLGKVVSDSVAITGS